MRSKSVKNILGHGSHGNDSEMFDDDTESQSEVGGGQSRMLILECHSDTCHCLPSGLDIQCSNYVYSVYPCSVSMLSSQ